MLYLAFLLFFYAYIFTNSFEKCCIKKLKQSLITRIYNSINNQYLIVLTNRNKYYVTVVLQDFDVSAGLAATFMQGPVNTKSVSRGGTAILRCQIPSTVRDTVTVASWLQDSSFNIYPSIKGGKYITIDFILLV